jgi:hypothetical protein
MKLAGALVAGLALLLAGGCTYDYLQRTDRVGYNAGNAVETNMAIQTIDPAKGTQYTTKGLGKDGNVIPTPTTDAGSAE